MIHSLDISGIQYEVPNELGDYIAKKIGRLDKFLPRHARKTATADVKIKSVTHDHKALFEVEAIMSVPDKTILAKESADDPRAAIDAIETKLQTQFKKYKQQLLPHVGRRNYFVRNATRLASANSRDA